MVPAERGGLPRPLPSRTSDGLVGQRAVRTSSTRQLLPGAGATSRRIRTGVTTTDRGRQGAGASNRRRNVARRDTNPLPTEEPVPDTAGAAPELEIHVWRCTEPVGSLPPLIEILRSDAIKDDDGTSGVQTGGIGCVPTATNLLFYPFGDMNGTGGGPMPIRVGADGRTLISVGLAPTTNRSPHLLSEPLSGTVVTFELMPATRTRITLFLGGLAPHPDTVGLPVLTLPATGSGRYPTIDHFLPGTLLVALVAGLAIHIRRRILRSRL
jgi:hypothetical protein